MLLTTCQGAPSLLQTSSPKRCPFPPPSPCLTSSAAARGWAPRSAERHRVVAELLSTHRPPSGINGVGLLAVAPLLGPDVLGAEARRPSMNARRCGAGISGTVAFDTLAGPMKEGVSALISLVAQPADAPALAIGARRAARLAAIPGFDTSNEEPKDDGEEPEADLGRRGGDLHLGRRGGEC